ncbi:hypothetical protein SNK04_007898 [Fusarium graminearum]
MCGGGCSEGESDISNLFVVQAAVIQATETQTELGDPGNQPAPATDFFTVTSSVVLVASAALPWQTSLASTEQDQVPPSSPVTVQQPPRAPFLRQLLSQSTRQLLLLASSWTRHQLQLPKFLPVSLGLKTNLPRPR